MLTARHEHGLNTVLTPGGLRPGARVARAAGGPTRAPGAAGGRSGDENTVASAGRTVQDATST